MRLLDTLERRFGRIAIPGVFLYLIALQSLVFIVSITNPRFIETLVLVPFSDMNGEWWRLFSFLAVPGARSPIMFVFFVMFTVFCSRRVELEWGAFRLTLFVAVFVIGQWLLAALAGTEFGQSLLYSLHAVAFPPVDQYHIFTSSLLFMNLFFAFAVLEPRFTILLYGLVPVSAWMLAAVDVGLIAVALIRDPVLWLMALISLLPTLIFAVPVYIRYCRHRSYVGSRRAKFKANSLTVVDSFHACKTCGRTEVTNPELDFRIAGDGNEYCGEHLPASNAGT